jgi:hypothetical protein
MRKVELDEHDFYSGSLGDLVALGFAPRDAFPGQPGRPLTSVSIRPAGVAKPRDCWHREPGYIEIRRGASGRFQMRVAVSELERRRRAARREQEAHRAQVEAQAAQQQAQAARGVAYTDWPFMLVDQQRWLRCNAEERGYVQHRLDVAFKELERLRSGGLGRLFADDPRPRQPAPRPSHLRLVTDRDALN